MKLTAHHGGYLLFTEWIDICKLQQFCFTRHHFSFLNKSPLHLPNRTSLCSWTCALLWKLPSLLASSASAPVLMVTSLWEYQRCSRARFLSSSLHCSSNCGWLKLTVLWKDCFLYQLPVGVTYWFQRIQGAGTQMWSEMLLCQHVHPQGLI